MKITKIRIKDHEDKDEMRLALNSELVTICDEIENHMQSMGFICHTAIESKQSIKIIQNQMQFSIDIAKLGYNTRYRPGSRARTNVPSWDQRVEFNDALNAILDRFGISANVKSGAFTIRKGFHSYTEEDWENQKPSYIRQNEANGYYLEQGDYKLDFANAKRKHINEDNAFEVA